MAATVKKELRDRIASLSDITTASYAVYMDRIPEGVTDYKTVVLSRNGSNQNPTLAADDDELITEQFEVQIRGKTSYDTEVISDAVIDDLQTLQGVNLGSIRKIGSVMIDNLEDMFEADDYGGDAGNAVIIASVTIMHVPQ
jgi:hypothetical protein